MDLLDKFRRSLKEDEATMLAKACEVALERGKPGTTAFIDAASVGPARSALDEMAGVDSRVFGGYRGAARARIAVAPAGYDWEGFDPSIGYILIRAEADPEETVAYMRAAGVLESDIGDVFRTDGGIGAVVSSAAKARLLSRGVDIGGLPAEVAEADPTELSFPGQARREIKSTVNSMRLDAIAACGFPASRTRLAQEIEIGRAKLNGRTVTDPSARVKQGDTIVIRGRGRMIVEEEGPITKKGRILLRISKYSAL